MSAFFRSEAPFIVAAASVVILYTVGRGWFENLDDAPKVVALLAWIFLVMLWASFAAVRHADHLAELLGEPYGTLILTLSAISIEVSVIAAVMLNADPDPELARDTMFAVLMIILNFIVGLSLLIGGLRHREQSFNLQGAQAFLGVLIPLATIALILPNFTGAGTGIGLGVTEAIIFCGVTLILYLTFLAIQTVRHSAYFVEPGTGEVSVAAAPTESDRARRTHRPAGYHAVMLLLTLIPIVLLSENFATLVDHGIETTAAPSALGGMLVAILVLAPEGFAALEAAARNHLQRAVNVCLGSALATIGLTVPAVLIVGLVTGLHVMLGLEADTMVLLALTFIVSLLTFGGARTNVLQGAVHLALFVVYIVLIFD